MAFNPTAKMVPFRSAYAVITVAVLVVIGVYFVLRSNAATIDVKAHMLASAPGTMGEDVPWGKDVNSNFPNYDWYDSAQTPEEMDITGNGGQYTRINWWGAVFRNEANANPDNTRVEITNCSLWILFKSTGAWTKLLGPEIGGSTFPPDYVNGSPGESEVTNITNGAVYRPGMNGIYHFWWGGGNGFETINPSDIKAAMSNCSARLVLANPGGPDDRDQSGYIVHMGADWRIAGQENNCNPCPGLGVGKFFTITKELRNVTWHTIPTSEITGGEVLPPAEAFGDEPGGPTPVVTPTPTVKPATPAPGNPTPTPNAALAKFDLDGNGDIGVGDLSILIRDYPRPGAPGAANSPADFNNNGAVDISDMSNLVKSWGERVR